MAIKPGRRCLTYTPENRVSVLPPTYENAASKFLLTPGLEAIVGVTIKSITPVEAFPAGAGHGEDLRHPW